MSFEDIIKQTQERLGVQPTSTTTPTTAPTYKPPVSGQQLNLGGGKKTTSGNAFDDILQQTRERLANKAAEPVVQQQEKPVFKNLWQPIGVIPYIKSKLGLDRQSMPDTVWEIGDVYVNENDVQRNPNLLPLYQAQQKETTLYGGYVTQQLAELPESITPKFTTKKEDVFIKPSDTAKIVIDEQAKKQTMLSDAPITKRASQAISNATVDVANYSRNTSFMEKLYNQSMAPVAFGEGFVSQGAKMLSDSYLKAFGNSGIVQFVEPYLPTYMKQYPSIAGALTLRDVEERVKAAQSLNNALKEQESIFKDNAVLEASFGLGKFSAEITPYIAADLLITKGYSSLPLIMRRSVAVKELAELTSWVGVGQVLYNEENGSRMNQLMWDLAGYAGFRALGIHSVTPKFVIDKPVTRNAFSDLIGTYLQQDAKFILPDGYTLTETGQAFVKQINEGKPVFMNNVEDFLKELQAQKVPGNATINGIDVVTNSKIQLDNFVENGAQVSFKIDSNISTPKLDFSPNRRVVITTNSVEQAYEIAQKTGQLFPARIQTQAIEAFARYLNIDSEELMKSLGLYALRTVNGSLSSKQAWSIVENLIKSIDNLLKKASDSLPPRLKREIKQSFDENPFAYIDAIARASLDETVYKSSAFRANNKEIVQLFESLNGSKLEPIVKEVPVIKESPKPSKEDFPKPEKPIAVDYEAKPDKKGLGISTRQTPLAGGEKTPGKISQRIKDQIESLTDEDLSEINISKVDSMVMVDQMDRAVDFVLTDPDKAMRVIRGEIMPPKNLSQTAVAVAMLNTASGDIDTVVEIANLMARRQGQEVVMWKMLDTNNPMRYITELTEKRGAVPKNVKESIKKAASETKRVTKESIIRESDVFDFIDDIMC